MRGGATFAGAGLICVWGNVCGAGLISAQVTFAGRASVLGLSFAWVTFTGWLIFGGAG